jgi:hypothetical protein
MRTALTALLILLCASCGTATDHEAPPVDADSTGIAMAETVSHGTPAEATATATPVPPDPPFTIEGPLAPEDASIALGTSLSGGELIVLSDDLTTLWILRPVLLDAASHRYASIGAAWLVDGTLGIVSEGRTYAWRLQGDVVSTQLPLPTRTPRADVSISIDNAWYAEQQRTERYFDTLVGRAGAAASLRLTNTVGAQWSPTDPTRFALLGNPCVFPGLYDVLLFDVDDPMLRVLTADLPDDVFMFLVNFRWHPDGTRIAIETWGEDEGARSRLLMVNIDSGDISSVALTRGSAPVPESWSPDGNYLLVRFEGAHGGLFCEQRSDWQPSVVEQLTP